MQIDIKGDMKSARRHLNQVQQQQIPFATSLAMNWTANDIRDYQRRRMQVDLDQPTPQVVKSIYLEKATKRHLRARVYFAEWAAPFMRLQIEGGRRAPRGKYEALPRNIKLTAAGNIGGRYTGRIRKLIAQKTTFIEQRGNVLGLWRRRARGRVELLIEFDNRALQYQARFPFYRYAQIEARRKWPRNFSKAMTIAINTARVK